MPDNEAIKPEAFTPFTETIDRTPEDLELERQGMQYKSLSVHPGWERVRKTMQDKIFEYRNLRSVDMKGMEEAEIGRKFLVSSLVADELESILNQVEAEDGIGE